ncbi:alpha-amylase [Granulicella sp. WH15]|uniref:alpha-amylase family glycosyl hydrolase n=1 Tax=Granulicella sp. WH15 TaxID=2602070 RepID=UPI001366C62B|nr:alpha-amylase family glycosyl hydrolase [Granulicella sp. WH15]QHN02611.1 alpha-amylase [Granulicella sp. WH15]
MRRLLLLLVASTAFAQSPVISKIDPPNWWPAMPAPMLLLRGENLAAASFTLSDKSLHITSTHISPNGHYAELFLSASPAHSEEVKITARNASGQTVTPYVFAPRRASSEDFAGFSSKDVMYLILTDRFADGDASNNGATDSSPRGWHGGDLRGILQHLDYLQELGITTIWITPVYENHGSSSYHGYGATDMYAVDEHYGTLADLKALAAALHARRMKLVLDTVPNHVGPAHPWVADSPEPTWFHGDLAHHTVAQQVFAPITNPHAPWRDQRKITEGWFVDTLPDLNQENPAVSQYLIQNAVWWTEQAGLDGFRIDTFPYVGRPFWHEFHARLHELYPHLTTVGEVSDADPTVVSTFAGGAVRTGSQMSVDTGLDTPFDFPTYYALRDALLKDAPMTRLAEVLRLDNLYPHPERLVPFIGNHDNSRFANDPAATPQVIDLAFTLLTTMRGLPQIYSGDEIAMRGGDDPDNRRDFPGGFPASSTNAFLASGRSAEQQHTFATLQRLLLLRRQHPALQSGEEQVLHASQDVLVYTRTLTTASENEHILIAINKGHSSSRTSIATDDTAVADLTHATSLSESVGTLSLEPKSLTLSLAPQTAAIFNLK